jgi:hypothetical protein
MEIIDILETETSDIFINLLLYLMTTNKIYSIKVLVIFKLIRQEINLFIIYFQRSSRQNDSAIS